MNVAQSTRDDFKRTLLSTVYKKAPTNLQEQLFKWKRTEQKYSNDMIQNLFELYLGGVHHGVLITLDKGEK